MHRRREIPDPLLRLASLQAGVVTREQAMGLGLTRDMLARLVDNGAWLRIGRGLFATVAVTPSWGALAWGGTLLGGPGSRLGPEASGYLYGLIGKPPKPIDVLVGSATPKRVQGPWQFIRERDGVRPGRSPGAPPRLTPECTVLDLAGQRPAGEVVGLVTKAVQKSLTTPDRLRSLLESRARQRHRQLIAGMLTEVAAGAESFLEVQYLRTVERPHGLPRGSRQGARRDLRYKRDVRYDEFAVIVELDGRLGHQAEGRFRDMSRDNRHALLDELTLRYGYFDVSSRACAVAYQVYRAIARRGFREPFLRCSVCAGLPEAYLQSA